MIGAIVHQLTRNLTDDQIETSPFAAYFVDHTAGVYPTAASGFPWNAASIGIKGDLIADLSEDLAADAAMLKQQHGPYRYRSYAGMKKREHAAFLAACSPVKSKYTLMIDDIQPFAPVLHLQHGSADQVLLRIVVHLNKVG